MGEAHRQRTCIGMDIPRSQDREHPIVLRPDICDNLQTLVIVINIWQKLSSVERKVTLIATNI